MKDFILSAIAFLVLLSLCFSFLLLISGSITEHKKDYLSKCEAAKFNKNICEFKYLNR